MIDDMLCHAAKDDLQFPVVPVGAHQQAVGADLLGGRKQQGGHRFRSSLEAVHAAGDAVGLEIAPGVRSEEHTSELQSLMRTSYAVFCLKKKNRSESTSLMHITQ